MEAATPRRIDAIRNDERILEGSMLELGRNPSAGMTDIAAACGVSRATLFRRYPTREGLIGAIREHAHEDLRTAVTGARLREDSATEALDRLIDALLSVGRPYAFLLQNPLVAGHEEGTRYIAKPVEALIRRGQESGEFDASAPPRWWLEIIVAVMMVATQRESRDAAKLMRVTLAGGLGTRCAASDG